MESALAPGMVTMKTFDPPLDALAGREVERVRPAREDVRSSELGDLALLVHLMSAGRLQLWDKRASLRDRASRLLVRLEDGRELRLREFGTQQRAWAQAAARRRGARPTRRSPRSARTPGPRRRSRTSRS